MARPGDNYKLRWRTKRANKGRKPSKGRVKGVPTETEKAYDAKNKGSEGGDK